MVTLKQYRLEHNKQKDIGVDANIVIDFWCELWRGLTSVSHWFLLEIHNNKWKNNKKFSKSGCLFLCVCAVYTHTHEVGRCCCDSREYMFLSFCRWTAHKLSLFISPSSSSWNHPTCPRVSSVRVSCVSVSTVLFFLSVALAWQPVSLPLSPLPHSTSLSGLRQSFIPLTASLSLALSLWLIRGRQGKCDVHWQCSQAASHTHTHVERDVRWQNLQPASPLIRAVNHGLVTAPGRQRHGEPDTQIHTQTLVPSWSTLALPLQTQTHIYVRTVTYIKLLVFA